jgi:ABC-type histidine transport system ATPase subunit
MVFQHFNLFPPMKVLENVMEGPRTVLKAPREAAQKGEIFEQGAPEQILITPQKPRTREFLAGHDQFRIPSRPAAGIED